MGVFEAELVKLMGELRNFVKKSVVNDLAADIQNERVKRAALEKRISELEQGDAEKLEKFEKRAQAREAHESRTSLREARMSLRGHL